MLLLIDINLGEKSGFDLCKEIRKNYDMPILFISARTSDDDYIKKPYTLSTLLAKVKAVLARYEKSRDDSQELIRTIWGVGYMLNEKILHGTI